MRFAIYGRFQLEVRRENAAWQAYRLEGGKRVPEEELVIPPDVGAEELAVYLDDIYHEYAGPGDTVELLA
jgi:hypothetical protein